MFSITFWWTRGLRTIWKHCFLLAGEQLHSRGCSFLFYWSWSIIGGMGKYSWPAVLVHCSSATLKGSLAETNLVLHIFSSNKLQHLTFLVCFYSNCCIKVNLSFQMRDLAVISDIFATNFVSWNYPSKKLSIPKSSLKTLDQRCDICKGIDRKKESSYIWGSKSFHLFSFFLLLTHWWMEGSSSQKFDWKLFFDMMLFTVLSHYVLVDI